MIATAPAQYPAMTYRAATVPPSTAGKLRPRRVYQ